jgi:hypothetical protein
MTLKERVIKLIEEVTIFVETNETYHVVLVISIVYLLAYGIPELFKEILRDNFYR